MDKQEMFMEACIYRRCMHGVKHIGVVHGITEGVHGNIDGVHGTTGVEHKNT